MGFCFQVINFLGLFSVIEVIVNHIELEHENYKVFQCDKCDKSFVTNWRLQKHIQLHTEQYVKPCHYFNNGRKCPFEELGCKFLHVVSKFCTSRQKCQRHLCPYRHLDKVLHSPSDMNVNDDEENVSNIEEKDLSDEELHSNGCVATSTPIKSIYDCEKCVNSEQCTHCFVMQQNSLRR